MTPEEVELRLLSAIGTAQDLTQITRDGIAPESFSIFGDVFEHIRKYIRAYDGVAPKPQDLIAQFGESGFKTIADPGDVRYYADELRKQALVRRVQTAITTRFGPAATNLLSDPDEAVRTLTEDLRKMARRASHNIAVLDRDAMVRLAWAEERQEAAKKGNVIGIPTGLAVFDDNLQGWQDGEAIMVMGPKGVGKSWLLMYFACVAYRFGRKILFLSPEMSFDECALRFDVVLGALAGKEFSLSELTTGKIATDVLEEYRVWLQRLSEREDFICLDSAETPGGAFTLEYILEVQEEFRPDMLLLDGIHLIGSEENAAGWERIKRTADGLKASAQSYKNVVVWCSQVDKEAWNNPNDPASTGARAAYGKAAVEAANRLITLGMYEGDARRRTFKVPSNRGGPTVDVRQHLLFDVEFGKIEQIEQVLPSVFDSREGGA